MTTVTIIVLVIVLMGCFTVLMISLLRAMPQQPLDEEAEAIKRDYAERQEKKRQKEEKRRREKA